MKICPKCKMTVDAENECPICYNTITYEPKVAVTKEKYVYNKYFLRYTFKNMWFSVLCLMVVILRLILKHQFVLHFCLYYCLIALAICISFLISFFKRKFSRFWQRKYSKEYSEFYANYAVIILGVIAVLLSFSI